MRVTHFESNMVQPDSGRRRAKEVQSPVAEWVVYFRRALRARRLQHWPLDDPCAKTAGLLALVGKPDEPAAQTVFAALTSLFFNVHRVRFWDAAISRVPANVEALQRLSAAVSAAGRVEKVSSARFQIHYFIDVALQLPDPVSYVDVCRRDGLDQIRAIFHPNTLKFTATKYRGVVGDLADVGYRETLTKKVKTVK